MFEVVKNRAIEILDEKGPILRSELVASLSERFGLGKALVEVILNGLPFAYRYSEITANLYVGISNFEKIVNGRGREERAVLKKPYRRPSPTYKGGKR